MYERFRNLSELQLKKLAALFLPLIKTHHHLFASGLGLAAEHKALFALPMFLR
jgi:hypothetical protein